MDQTILEKFGLTKDEQKFVTDSSTAITGHMNYSRVISNLYLSKTIEQNTDKIIESNRRLADSNNKYSRAMLWLTGGLVLVGIIQIIVNFWPNNA